MLWRTPLCPSFCQWMVVLIIPSIVLIYKTEGGPRPVAFSPTDSPPVVLLVSWGQRRGGGAITRSTETVEDVALPPPFGARGWLARRLALAILWMSSLGKEGNQHWYLTRWRKCFCVEIELEFEVLCVVCSKCGNSNVSNQLRVLLVNKEKWNLLLREAIFFCYKLFYIYSKTRPSNPFTV